MYLKENEVRSRCHVNDMTNCMHLSLRAPEICNLILVILDHDTLILFNITEVFLNNSSFIIVKIKSESALFSSLFPSTLLRRFRKSILNKT